MRVGDGYLDLGGHDKERYRSFIEMVALESNLYDQESARCLKGFCETRRVLDGFRGNMTHFKILREPGKSKAKFVKFISEAAFLRSTRSIHLARY